MVSVYIRQSLHSSFTVWSGWHFSPLSLTWGNKEHSPPPLDGMLVYWSLHHFYRFGEREEQWQWSVLLHNDPNQGMPANNFSYLITILLLILHLFKFVFVIILREFSHNANLNFLSGLPIYFTFGVASHPPLLCFYLLSCHIFSFTSSRNLNYSIIIVLLLQTSWHHHFPDLHNTKRSISLKPQKDIPKRKTLFFCISKCLSTKQQLFFMP